MRILVTGAKGFIGKNLVAELKNRKFIDIFEYDLGCVVSELKQFAETCDFVFHLAGVNRPENPEEFMQGNFGFTSELLSLLKQTSNKAPILITSSTQAALDNPYGKSKLAGEELIFEYGRYEAVPVFVYRLPNVFGKWSRPNYNSAVATFCHNIARGLEIQVNDPNVDMKLVYVDDVVESFIAHLNTESVMERKHHNISPVHEVKLGHIVELIKGFKESRDKLSLPKLDDAFTKKLYSTYLSFLPTDQFSYPLKMNVDHRGSFTEFIKTPDRGQVSINISKPGITKGNHWHHTKNEKFLVVSGNGVIQFRGINSDEIIEYRVSGEKLEVIDIPTGYTHNIINVGDTDLVTVMWVNEIFDPSKPDTFFLEV